MRHAKTLAAITYCAAIALGPGTAWAQDTDPSIYEPCSRIGDDMERLACFDRTYAQETEIIAERVEEKRQRTVADFGLSPKQINEREERESERAAQAVTSAPASEDSGGEAVAAAPAEQAEDGQITTTVTEVLTDALGNYVLILDNGQMWRSTSNKTFRGRIRTGWSVTIRKIWSGGFRMKIEDKRGFLGVTRIR